MARVAKGGKGGWQRVAKEGWDGNGNEDGDGDGGVKRMWSSLLVVLLTPNE